MPTEAPRFRGWLSEIGQLAAGAFPSFVTSLRGTGCDIGLPVFVYHTIDASSFEAELRFLTANGYQTLDADSFHAILTGRKPRQGNEVLLTVDDGRSSVWVWACPLLAKYGHRAVAFVIPGCVPERRQLLAKLGDSTSQQSAHQEIEDHDPELMSWDEIRIAQQNSVLDIQSHTLFHRQVPVGPEIEDFVTLDNNSPFYAVPLPGDAEVGSLESLVGLAGLPIFRSAPLLSTKVIYQEVPEVLNAPVELVRKHGRDTFFRQAGWRRALISAVRNARLASPAKGRFLEPHEVRAAILKELTDSKALIEERLEGKRVNHLCLPFSAGSELAVELAKEAGYQSVFWGARRERPVNAVGDDPFFCTRLKHDYIFRLPGKGRRSLSRILLGKVLRRLRGEAVY